MDLIPETWIISVRVRGSLLTGLVDLFLRSLQIASITDFLRPLKTDMAFLLRDFTARTPYGNIYIKRFTRALIEA